MKKLSHLTLVFALLFAVFFLLLILFRTPFPLYPLMSFQDAFDLLTPLVLIPIYWLLFRAGSGGKANRTGEVIFLILASVWVLGHGMHLAANSINNLSENLARNQILDITGTSIYTLTYFLDEQLSHDLWHGGILGLAALLCYSEWRAATDQITIWWVTILGGIIHGFSMFAVFLEGQTVLLGFPFTLLLTLIVLIWARKHLPRKPLLAFFFIASVVAVLFFTGWGLYWGGFPEFSDVGII